MGHQQGGSPESSQIWKLGACNPELQHSPRSSYFSSSSASSLTRASTSPFSFLSCGASDFVTLRTHRCGSQGPPVVVSRKPNYVPIPLDAQKHALSLTRQRQAHTCCLPPWPQPPPSHLPALLPPTCSERVAPGGCSCAKRAAAATALATAARCFSAHRFLRSF